MSTSTSQEPQFLLYSYYRSSCSARVRIALNIKNIPVSYKFVHLQKSEQTSSTHKELNPTASVPVLIHLSNKTNDNSTEDDNDTDLSFPITQSMAALEYLEEAFSRDDGYTALLPPLSQPMQRAKVRIIANIIACDIQPVTNLRVAAAVAKDSADVAATKAAWMKEWMEFGFVAIEETLKKIWDSEKLGGKDAGGERKARYCVGDEVTLADVCLVPAVWNAERFGVELERFPRVKRVYEALMEVDGVKRAHWKVQDDTPAELR